MKPIVIKLDSVDVPKTRKTWGINPRTRIKDSAKKFVRSREKQKFLKELSR